MKTTFLTLCAFILLFTCFKANATIWRINNNGFTANFTSLQSANDDNKVSNGDTIHLEGSPIVYSSARISKKLIIIGPGYFLIENSNSSYSKLQAQIFGVSFNTGSDGSQLLGVFVGGTSAGIDIYVTNIVLKRCRIDYSIFLAPERSDITIVQNYFYGSSTSSVLTYTSGGFPTNVVFNNNICQKTLILPDGNAYTLAECKNNVFDCPAISGSPSIKMNVGSFENNILKTTNATVNINTLTNNNVAYNIGTSVNNQFGTANNNIVVANIANLFVDPATNSPDGDYQLRPGSAGSNNGSDGTDRGAFGGLAITNRYTLSGLPPIPVIYNITTTGVTTSSSPLSVTITAKTVQ